MAIQEFGVTYSDVEFKLQGFSFDVAEQVKVAALITTRAAQLNAILGREGFNVEEEPIATTDRLYKLCAEIIALKVAAEIGRCYSHMNPELSVQRDQEAKELMETIHTISASISSESFTDRENRRGSFQGFGGPSRAGLRPNPGSGFSGS